jgi:hypothetical protein
MRDSRNIVIASEAKQSILSLRGMDCFASLAMTEEHRHCRA